MSEPASHIWTEFRPRFALVVASVASAGVLVGIESGPSRALLAVVVAVATAASIALDGYGGVVIGLAGAACLILVKRLTGELTPQEFFLVGAEVATVMTMSWLVGILGHHLRSSVERVTGPSPGSIIPTANLMGVIGADLGMHRLEEELSRRQASGSELGLALVSHRPAGTIETVVPEPARRAIARHVESVLGDADVLFSLDDDTLAIILPTADWTSGLVTLGQVAVAATQATYADPADRRRRAAGDTVSIRTSLVFADDATAEARTFVAAARSGLGTETGASR